MLTVNIHDAKTHLSSLLANLDETGAFTIARNGEPVATVEPVRKSPRLGFMKGYDMVIPADFTELDAEVTALFEESDIYL